MGRANEKSANPLPALRALEPTRMPFWTALYCV